MSEQDPHYDVVIIGGGVSGIGAACHLRQKLPHLTFIILESRDSLGGTWDFYKYPGVRTDSDMYTMAYSFNPWKDNKTTASASAVNSYLKSTADLMNIPDHVRFNEKVEKICWSSKDSMWTIHTHRTKGSGSTSKVTGRFVFMCAGYTNFNHIHKPDIKNIEAFKGRVVHPQSWPDDLDYADKEIVVIGSGATAVTLVPALADAAKHVTMLQRSPSYILQLPNIDPVAAFCARYLPASIGNTIMRCKNIFEQQVTYAASRVWNDGVRNLLILGMKMNLKKGYDVKAHFTPKYPVLTQRLCLSPDTDFTDAINNKGVTVITDSIDCVTETGIQLASGTRLDADIIVTATGFDLCALGGVQVEIDGVVIENAASSCVYKGALLCGIPNLVVALGYLTASWTLRIDLIWSYTCRLLEHMEKKGKHSFCPSPPPDNMPLSSVFKIFNSSYLNRGAARFFKQGTSYPYVVNTSYYADWWTFHYGALEDQWIELN